jgi:L-2-hydroxycarboxylate dehydrogenase (NAD+)
MLEQFHVPEDEAVRVDPEAMRQTVHDIFVALGMPEEHAAQSTDVLLYADTRGIDSHGVSNMLRVYVDRIRSGDINVNPQWKVVREAAAVATIDSDGAHGGVIGPEAMRMAIERAREYGVGAVTVYRGGHYGAAAYTAAMALEHDMIGVSMTAGGVQVTPTFGAEALIGLNPIAVAVPTRNEPPFIFDASMSSVAGNKVRLARRLGRDVLPGWVAGEDGDPIMEEAPLPEPFLMLPLGGTREIGSHKGYGLGVMVEVLTTVLAGGGGGPDRRGGSAHHLLAYKVDAFTDLEQFKDDMDAYLKRLTGAKTAPGHERVLYAGLPEHEEEMERRERGIPYHPEVIGWFKEITSELGIPDRLPAVTS